MILHIHQRPTTYQPHKHQHLQTLTLSPTKKWLLPQSTNKQRSTNNCKKDQSKVPPCQDAESPTGSGIPSTAETTTWRHLSTSPPSSSISKQQRNVINLKTTIFPQNRIDPTKSQLFLVATMYDVHHQQQEQKEGVGNGNNRQEFGHC